jgi:nitrate reductase gamma subunit
MLGLSYPIVNRTWWWLGGRLAAPLQGGSGFNSVTFFSGLSLLIHRRVFDARIRATSHPTDIGARLARLGLIVARR